MLALSSYNSEFESGIWSGLNAQFGSRTQLEGIFVDTVLSSKGSFIRFQWADWPDDLQQGFAARVSQFHKDHDYLQPVEAGSPEWNVAFGGSVADSQAARKIAQILEKHLESQANWVRGEKDVKGKIKAWVGLKGGGSIVFCLSWKDYSVGGIGLVDFQALRSAIAEVHQWAGQRIQPILDTLEQKLRGLYGDRFRGLYVFGSYARPDAGIELPIDSDLDVAVLLSDIEDRYREVETMSEIAYDLSLEHGLSVSLTPLREDEFREGNTSFAKGISAYAKSA